MNPPDRCGFSRATACPRMRGIMAGFPPKSQRSSSTSRTLGDGSAVPGALRLARRGFGRSARVHRTRVKRRTQRGQRGSITAETAVAFPALVVVLAVALWGVSAAAAQVACVDAARAGARAAARGEPAAEVRAAVLRAAPSHARVAVSRDSVTTTVVVQAEARAPLKALFPALRLRAQAVAATEPEGGDTATR